MGVAVTRPLTTSSSTSTPPETEPSPPLPRKNSREAAMAKGLSRVDSTATLTMGSAPAAFLVEA